MQQFSDKLKSHRCPTHNRPIEFICIEVDCTHKQRRRCTLCLKQGDREFVHIAKLSYFLGEHKKKEEKLLMNYKMQLRQSFKTLQTQIQKQLDQLSKVMELNITQIGMNYGQLYNLYKDRAITGNDIEQIGIVLSQIIELTDNDECKFKKIETIEGQSSYINSMEILDKQKLLLEQLCNGLVNPSPIKQNTLKSKQSIEQEQQQQQQQLLQTSEQILTEIIQQIQIEQDAPIEMPNDSLQLSASEFNNPQNIMMSQQIQFETAPLNALFNHNQKQIAITHDKNIELYSVTSDNQSALDQVLQSIKQVCFNSDSTLLAAVNHTNEISFWQKEQDGDGKWVIKERLEEYVHSINTIGFNNDSTYLISGSDDKLIRVHTNKDGEWTMKQAIEHHEYCVFTVEFSPNDEYLATGDEGGIILITRCYTDELWVVIQKLTKHTKKILATKFNQYSKCFYTGSMDSSICIWHQQESQEWECRQQLSAINSPIRGFIINEIQNNIVTFSVDRKIQVWKQQDVNQWEHSQTIDPVLDMIYSVITKEDSNTLLLLGLSGTCVKISQMIY